MKSNPFVNRLLLWAPMLVLVAAATYVFAAHVALIKWADILYHDDPYLLHRVIDNEPNYYLPQNLFLFYRETLYAMMGRYTGYFLPKLLILVQAAAASLAFYYVARRSFQLSKIVALVGAIAPWVLPIQAQVFFGVNTSYTVVDVLFIAVAFLVIEDIFHKKHFALSFVLFLLLLLIFVSIDTLAFVYMPLPALFLGYQSVRELMHRWWRVFLTLASLGVAGAYSFVVSAPVRAHQDANLAGAMSPERIGEFWNEITSMFGYMSPYAGELVNQWGAHYVLGSWISAAVVALAFIFAVLNHRSEIARAAGGSWLRGVGAAIMVRDFRVMAVCFSGILFFFWIYSISGGPQARYSYPAAFFFGMMLAYALISLLHAVFQPLLRVRFRHVIVACVAALACVVAMTRKDAHARETHFPEVFLYNAMVDSIPPEQMAAYDGIVLSSRWVFVQHSGMPYLMHAKLWYAAARRYGEGAVIPPYVMVNSDNTCQAIFRGPTEDEIHAAPWQAMQIGLERDRRYLFFRAHIDERRVFPLRYVANSDASTATFEVLDMSETPTRVIVSSTTQAGLIEAVAQAGIDPATISNMPQNDMTCIPPHR